MPSKKARWLSIGAVAIVVGIGITAAVLLTGNGPEMMEFYLDPATPATRSQLVEELRQRREELLALDIVPDAAADGWREDVLQIAAAVEDYAIRKGSLPHRISDLEISPDEIAPGIRIVSGRSHWRLYGPDGSLLARGN
ncbi:hypothetical protein KQI84_05480 [bacterium]|nr:hypothetical protein [bacterium]